MIKQQIRYTTSSAFYNKNQVISWSIYHELIKQAQQISDKIQYRPFKDTDIFQIVNLQKQWFPISYGANFYNRIVRKQVHCIIAETSIKIKTQSFIKLLIKQRLKDPPMKIHNSDSRKGYFNFQSNICQNQISQVKIIVGLVVFQKTNSRGYLAENWWKGFLQTQLNSYYIMTLGVIQQFRKKGIAKYLIQKIKLFSQTDERIKLIFLHVIDYNKAAIKLYEKQDFILLQDINQFYNIQGNKYDGKALGIYLRNGKKPITWKQWFWKFWQ